MSSKEKILVVAREILFPQGKPPEGFLPCSRWPQDLERMLLACGRWLPRKRVEDDPNWKQIIPYCLIRDSGGRFLAYQRACLPNHYSEQRLWGKWSWGVGGHIKEQDRQGVNPIREALKRELQEELDISLLDPTTIPLVGALNSERDEVSRVHFGLVFVISIKNPGRIRPSDSEITRWMFATPEELKRLSGEPNFQVEEWSKLLLGKLTEPLCSL